MEWISVNDRLPELTEKYDYSTSEADEDQYSGIDSKAVLITGKGFQYSIGHYANINTGELVWFDENASDLEVTHWMELPELPK